MNPNTTMCRADLVENGKVKAVTQKIIGIQRRLHGVGLQYSNWWGTLDEKHLPETKKNKGSDYKPIAWAYDDANIPWFCLWEYAWTLVYSGLLGANKPRTILSIGGAASVLDTYLVSLGHEVHVIDRNKQAMNQARDNADAIGGGHLVGYPRDLRNFNLQVNDFGIKYDYVFCLSVIHILDSEVLEGLKSSLQDVTKPGAAVALTFDWENPNPRRWIGRDNLMRKINFQGFDRIADETCFIDRGEHQLVYYPDSNKGPYTMGVVFLNRA